ncbi:MAG: histidine--tRNA ligase, partial [Syntrophomonas sp.]
PYLDAEIIILLVEILNRLGINDYELHLNSVGCPVCRQAYRQDLIEHIRPLKENLCRDCKVRFLQNPLRVLDCKNESCHQAIEGCPSIYNSLCPACRDHYTRVRQALEDNSISYLHDDKLVRGLDYYTNTAFEIHIPGIGAQSAVGGGGRYNGLVKELGGPDLPGIGFALGMERLLLALDTLGINIYKPSRTDVFVVLMNDIYEGEALKILNCIRKAGIRADKDFTGRSGKAQMKFADRLGARLVVLIGDEEMAGGFFTIRNMRNKEQIQVEKDILINGINRILATD